jgi:3-methyladenine DNA glycosylase/8-oxoguanine DNA glycosylase
VTVAEHALRYRPVTALDVHATLAPHMRGPYDPCHRVDSSGAHWRTWRTPDGPATVRLTAAAADEVDVRAWGPGGPWALAAIPALLGADDDWAALALPAGVLRDTRRKAPGLRLSRSGRVFEALAPAVLEQLVTNLEAWQVWSRLLGRFGEPAPGPNPLGLKVFPDPKALRRIPSWEWHRLGLDGKRRQTLLAAASVAHRIDECARLGIEESARRLLTIPGVGPWTVAETLQRSHGAADLVSVGDYGLPGLVGHVLAGREGCDDAGMLELLEPYRGHRQRVVRLVLASGSRPARRGPRLAPRDYRAI